jgi:lysophospholipase L1-like esterase
MTGSVRTRLVAILAAAVTAVTLGAPTALATDRPAVGSPTDRNISFVGRWDTTDPTAYVPNWAGAYFTAGFTGTTVKLQQRDVIDVYYRIDGGDFSFVQNVSGLVDLTPTPLAAGRHTLTVSYAVVGGNYHGDAVFQGLSLDQGAQTYHWPASPRAHRLVEFVGDSITLGTTSSKNALTAYGWLVGERLGVRHTQLGYGGGCLVSAADGCAGIAERFFHTGYAADSALWDFSRYQADAVVINLGTNDLSHKVTPADFQDRYVRFLGEVRAAYPHAELIALETFSARYAAQTQAAVDAVRAAGDRRVSYVDTTGWLTAEGRTDSVHPNDAGHQAIADRLTPIVAQALHRGGR